MNWKAALLSILGAVSFAQAEDKLVGGPFVVNVGPQEATIAWVVESAQVKIGPQPGEWTATTPVLRGEKITRAGLKPDTIYHYQVMGGEEGRGQFRTPPAKARPFQFVVFGDTRSRHDVHRRVVAAISKLDPEFVILLGDLVDNGANTASWATFFWIEQELLRKTVFFPVIGNHERQDPQYFEFLHQRSSNYSFNWGSSHFTVFDSEPRSAGLLPEAREEAWTRQKRWLESDLEANQKAEFRIVVFHSPPFTAVKRRQAGSKKIQELVPLMEKYKVHAVFSGHDHNYQHHLNNGIHYIVTGGGGAPLYPVDGPIPGITQKAESVDNFTHIKVDGRLAQIKAYTPDGREIETIDLSQ